MKKVVTLFKRDFLTQGRRTVVNELTPGCEWVVAGEGVATRKFDGACCMVRGGRLFKRFDAHYNGKPPENWEPCQEADPITGHWPGWLPVGLKSEDKYFNEGFSLTMKTLNDEGLPIPDGTYELCGPKVQKNPEKFESHRLIRHGSVVLESVPRDFEGLKSYLKDADIEGIVWHQGDGRMAKIKKRDFGFHR